MAIHVPRWSYQVGRVGIIIHALILLLGMCGLLFMLSCCPWTWFISVAGWFCGSLSSHIRCGMRSASFICFLTLWPFFLCATNRVVLLCAMLCNFIFVFHFGILHVKCCFVLLNHSLLSSPFMYVLMVSMPITTNSVMFSYSGLATVLNLSKPDSFPSGMTDESVYIPLKGY
ncbi:hypothetical protein BRADI_4g27621v3 [Brachypodium distachyon]|uniref:Uncharacterized protein n=1 Tax=Brachypodium distachyon TaxID=15368 RepID=A0A0Q3IUQ2_BRADI|nr:hypothetical protein BRADI_4g27621v3 [Brachypodium distachyon]